MNQLRTLKIGYTTKKMSIFNIYSALKKKEKSEIRKTELEKDSLEYRLVAKLFTDSIG